MSLTMGNKNRNCFICSVFLQVVDKIFLLFYLTTKQSVNERQKDRMKENLSKGKKNIGAKEKREKLKLCKQSEILERQF